MKLIPVIDWKLDDGREMQPLDARLLPLLQAIGDHHSLAAAIVECGISYRAGWGVLRDYEQRLGAPLADLERGRGATLTPLGESLLAARRSVERKLGPALQTSSLEIPTVAAQRAEPALPPIRVAASHDLVLASLEPLLARIAPRVALQIEFQGSLRALEAFAKGNVDLAGFHVPLGDRVTWDPAEFRQWLDSRTDRLIRCIEREQGLIVLKGNPMRVRGFRDIAAHALRFVNRQRGSGTRILIDRLLADEGISPSAIHGYSNEEFTHAAVAATVASGGADVGYGLRAAGVEFGLDFVPILREQYYFAVRARQIREPAFAQLLDALRSARFAQHVRRYAGCSAAGAGSVEAVGVLESR